MKLELNKEYALRHLCVGALFVGLSLWSFYDAIFKYPNDEALVSKVGQQYFQAVALALVAGIIFFLLKRQKAQSLEWNNEIMYGSLTGGKDIRFDDITNCDWSNWDKKGIVIATTKDGKSIKLDSWHHTGVTELAKLLPGYPAPKTEEPAQ